MNRIRIITTLLASVLVFAVLPALPALASANATARLTNNATVFPGSYTYTLQLNNTEAGGLLGNGKAINHIGVELPQGAGITVSSGTPTAGAFTPMKQKVGNTDWVLFEGSSLSPGSSLNINIPSIAKAPNACDASGVWRVWVSSNAGETSKLASATAPGALDAKVKVLEVIGGTVKPVAPTNADNTRGVTDRSGTAGQAITYVFDVRNHAVTDQSIVGSLSSDKTEDTPGPAQSQTIAGGGGTTTYTVPVTLGSASAQRTTTFTANASGSCATAAPLADSFTVQVPVDLSFSSLQPLRVRSGETSAKTFTVTIAKSGGAQADITAGSLKFGTNEATLQNTPRTFNAGSQTVSGVEYAIASITGAEGPLAASTTSVGEDYNLAPVNITKSVGTITIDITAPTLTIDTVNLPLDGDGDQQTAVRNGNTVTATGTVVGSLTPPSGNDLEPGCPTVQAVPNAGAALNFSVTCADNEAGNGKTWTATLSNTVWDSGATAFAVTATMKDIATNEGLATAPGPYLIDLKTPELGGYVNQFKGTVDNPTTISVLFEDNLLNNVRGGCDTSSWAIDGRLGQVREVQLGDGTVCSGSDAGADTARRSLSSGRRVLILHSQFAKHPHETPRVTYTPSSRTLNGYPTKDGAANDALAKTIDTVTKVIPPTPQISAVQRRDNTPTAPYEPAHFDTDESAYYTNVGGEDGVRLSWTFSAAVTVEQVSGYKIRVTDGNGAQLAQVDAGVQDPLTGAWSGQITVPLGAADGTYARRLHVVSPGGVLSDPNPFTVVLDRVLPTLSDRAFNGTDTVTVSFAEKIVAGANFSSDWTIGYEIEGPNGTETAYTRAEAVELVDELTRRLTVTSFDPSAYRSADYRLASATRARYEDRAGNLMADTFVS